MRKSVAWITCGLLACAAGCEGDQALLGLVPGQGGQPQEPERADSTGSSREQAQCWNMPMDCK
jgi:hypothetical protein